MKHFSECLFYLNKIVKLANVYRLGKVSFFVLLFALFVQEASYASFSPSETQMIRINIVENGLSHEWEFDHPDQYEYEVGEKIVKGLPGERIVKEMIHTLQLQETSQIEDMVAMIKKRYPNLQHLDIRMRNAEGKLYTWVWNKDRS